MARPNGEGAGVLGVFEALRRVIGLASSSPARIAERRPTLDREQQPESKTPSGEDRPYSQCRGIVSDPEEIYLA